MARHKNNKNNKNNTPSIVTQWPSLPSTPPQSSSAMSLDDGWDEDLDFDDESFKASTEAAPSTEHPSRTDKDDASHSNDSKKEAPSDVAATKDDWDFDDDDIDVLDTSRMSSAEPLNDQELQLFQTLQSYMHSLPLLLPSLNAVLEAEYNTYHHALELASYYHNRPALYNYTLDTELDRMDYEIRLPDGTHLQDKDKVKRILEQTTQPDALLLIRCANQSLLADVLAVLTGPDALVRPQYMATAVATHCRFSILPQQVHCACDLRLSLPHPTLDRIDVAQLHVTVDFAPHTPSLRYHLERVELLDDVSPTMLQETATFLLPLVEDLLPQHEEGQTSDGMRDAFLMKLSSTQQFVQATNVGMASALQQMDAVVNVSHKVEFLRSVLPSTDQILAASELSSETQPPQQQSDMPTPSGAVEQSTQLQQGQSRPVPILGGLLRSGWSRLAQSVTLPDEERVESTPTLYRTEIPRHSENNAPALYGMKEPVSAPRAPQLYRTEDEPIALGQSREEPLQLYRREAPPAEGVSTRAPVSDGTSARMSLPRPSPAQSDEDAEEEIVQDGWDDDLDMLDDDDGLAAPISPQPPLARPASSTGDAVGTVLASKDDASPLSRPKDELVVETRKRWVNPVPGPRRLII